MCTRRVASLLLVCCTSALLAAQTATPEKQKFSPPYRKFRFTYAFTVKDIPADAKLVRVWVPVAHTDEHQTVRLVNVKAPVPTTMGEEAEYGNHILYAEIHNPVQSTADFALEYEVTRREYARGDFAQLERKDTKPGVVPASMQRFVEPDKLIPTDGKIKQLADQVTGSQTGTVAKAKAAYDYLFTTMRYDKTGTGWGRGDAVWACDAKHGNCTDFHSPFIGMMRADDIPARFDIGYPIPENKDSGDIAGYHCWAEFFARNIGWVPLDISEAWKAKEKAGYFFGTVDANRVQLSTGRDITLSPRQDGPPLNYFVYPYIEIDGKAHDAMSRQVSFSEKSTQQDTAFSRPPAPAM
ncbi:MAG TPA: transglutaminase domain-containing protein [Candidatus Bathyarchaeia archaeon]|nr:transglutaminase domain-containing protein [Candidatus Bathyarchaeia archaeon]